MIEDFDDTLSMIFVGCLFICRTSLGLNELARALGLTCLSYVPPPA